MQFIYTMHSYIHAQFIYYKYICLMPSTLYAMAKKFYAPQYTP